MKKTLLILFSALCLAATGHAQKVNEAITADQLKEVKPFLAAKPGDVVKLQFTYRGEFYGISNTGDIRSTISGKDRADVIVPPELSEWFQRVSDSYDARKTLTVYGIVEPYGSTSSQFKSVRVRFIGREIKTTFQGKQMIW